MLHFRGGVFAQDVTHALFTLVSVYFVFLVYWVVHLYYRFLFLGLWQ